MLPATAEYLAYEALPRGARPAVRATFLPYLWQNGVNADGDFVECSFIAPDRIQADYHGFTGGYWISPVLTANLQVPSSPAVVTWGWNYPGFEALLYYRGADTAANLALAAWTLVNQGDTVQIYPYYQIKLTLEGYRAWAEDISTGDREFNLNLFVSSVNESLDTDNFEWNFEQQFDLDQFIELVNSVVDVPNDDGFFDLIYFVEMVNAVSSEGNGIWDLDILRWNLDLSVLGDDFTAWAEDSENDDSYQGYAFDANTPGDVLTYIEALQLLGEFTILRDIEQAGSLSMEAPLDFSDLVAGSHSGLLLNNRQGSFVGGIWTPAPLFSPNKSSFFLTQQDWYNIQLKIELGWSKGGWFESGHMEGEWLSESYTDFITLFLGRVKKWGPVSRAVGAPNNVEVYATDLVMDCLQKRICLPAADGSPAPLTYGEFLCKGEAVSGWSPAPVVRSAYFEANNYNELDHVVASGGGAFSLITPGLTGDWAFRAVVTGANQGAYGAISRGSAGEMFVTGTLRFTAAPASPADNNFTLLDVVNAAGTSVFKITVDSTGALYGTPGGQSNFNILAYLDVPLSYVLWVSPVANGKARLWINGDEVLSYDADLSSASPQVIRFGAITGATAESWTVDFDGLEVRTKYYHNAFQVYGAPFDAIGPVYIDNLAQPDSKTVGAFTQTLTRYPAYGLVQFESTDPDFNPSGEVLIRVIEHAGGRHALAHIEGILAQVGLTSYIDATSLAAAYLAVPNDIIHSRFEGGSPDKRGLKDMASLGMPAGDAIKEICSRMLYWFFMDAGKIKIVPYTGTPPAGPVVNLTASNKWENNQVIDLENINTFVSAVYGWYSRNPSLFYVAGTQEAGGQGAGLDFTWDSPVCCENRAVVTAKADLLLKFLSAQDVIDPVTMTLSGARIELMSDVVSLRDELLNDTAQNYLVRSKEVGLDKGSRETSLQLVRFLGE